MPIYLHNPASEAHLQDLRNKLVFRLVDAVADSFDQGRDADLIEGLVNVVRSMDKGSITTKDALEVFTRQGFSSFSKWLVDMLDEGIYVDSRFDQAA